MIDANTSIHAQMLLKSYCIKRCEIFDTWQQADTDAKLNFFDLVFKQEWQFPMTINIWLFDEERQQIIKFSSTGRFYQE